MQRGGTDTPTILTEKGLRSDSLKLNYSHPSPDCRHSRSRPSHSDMQTVECNEGGTGEAPPVPPRCIRQFACPSYWAATGSAGSPDSDASNFFSVSPSHKEPESFLSEYGMPGAIDLWSASSALGVLTRMHPRSNFCLSPFSERMSESARRAWRGCANLNPKP